MKPVYPRTNGNSSCCLPGRCVEPRSAASPPGDDSIAVPAESVTQLAQLAKQPAAPPLPMAPATLASGIQLPSPAAAVGSEAVELPSLVPQPFSAFGSLSQFQDAQRMATLLARASIVPESYRGEAHIGDCVIALEIANRIGASILAVMQNLQPVRGRLGWSSQFLISCVNASQRFSPLRYQMTGTRGADSWGCIAWACDKTGELLQSPEVTIKMAKAEGWYYRPSSKWRTLPELMLRYRSATLFTRLYAPELTMGLQTTEEVAELSAEGIAPVTRPSFEAQPAKRKSDPQFNPETRLERPLESTAPPPSAGARSRGDSAPELAPTPDALATPLPPGEHQAPTRDYNYLKALNGLIGLSPHSEADVLTYLCQSKRCEPSLASLAEVAQQQPDVIVWAHDHWNRVEPELNQLGKGRTP